MYKKILVPLDRSSLAERVLTHLQWLAPMDMTEIALLTVIQPSNYYDYAYGCAMPTPPDWAEVNAYVTRYLDAQATRLRHLGHSVSIHVTKGEPAEMILAFAKEWQADLIAMSTHGRSGFTRWALGSVAERVIHGVTVPIFLVREQAPVSVGQGMRILVPLDGSELAEQALPQAQEIARNSRARILLLRVLDTFDREDLGMFFEDKADVDETWEKWQAEAGAYLDAMAKRMRASGTSVETRVVSGEPDKVIGDVATRERVNLIVMSTHGRSGVSRWIYGSTANKVLRSVTCPLILVRANWPEGNEPSIRSDKVFSALPD